MKKKFYAVKVGRHPGIYETWAECEKEVKNFAGAKFKSFTEREDAVSFINCETTKHTDFNSNSSSSLNLDDDSDFLIYTDGSCLKNPGAGGYAAVIINKNTGETVEISGGEDVTTNNRMELSAAFFALKSIEENSTVTLVTDSQYLKDAFTKNWIRGWQRNNWKTSLGTDVKNRDLWEKLMVEVNRHKLNFKWVKGHAGNFYNERCDLLARSEAKKRQD